MHCTHVAYGGCWKCPQLCQRCNSTTPRFAASQNGFVHSFGTGIGRVTLLQSLIFALRLSLAVMTGLDPAIHALPNRSFRAEQSAHYFAGIPRLAMNVAGHLVRIAVFLLESIRLLEFTKLR